MGILTTLWSPRWRWLTIAIAWVAVAALAQSGLSTVTPRLSVWDRLYLTPKLFSLGFSDDLARQDWRVQVARFVGPVVFASTFFAATAALFHDQIARFRLRYARDHVVVAGLGDKGSRIARSFHDDGRRVVAVERDPANPDIIPLRRHGVSVVVGDAADPSVLAEVGVSHAERLVVVAGADGTCAEVAAAARTVERRADRPLLCAVHVVDAQLSRLLRVRELSAARDGLRYDFFNVFQRGARRWLADAAPFAPDPLDRPHHLVVVLGDDGLGEALVVAAAQRGLTDGDVPPRVTIVDPDANRRLESLRLRHAALVSAAPVDAVELDPDRPNPGAVEAFDALLRAGSVTAVFVAIDDDTAALSTGLAIRQGLGTRPSAVHVRTRFDAGLARLVADDPGDGLPVTLRTFGLIDRTCTAEAVSGGTNEQVARALHDDYLARSRAEGRTGGAVTEWDDLGQETKESNRHVADDLVSALGDVGVGLSPLYGWDRKGFDFTRDELDTLARREHQRWAAERQRAGWRHGSERDDAAKLNPLLVGWDELPEASKQFNRDAAHELPALLARAGFELVRLPGPDFSRRPLRATSALATNVRPVPPAVTDAGGVADSSK